MRGQGGNHYIDQHSQQRKFFISCINLPAHKESAGSYTILQFLYNQI